MENNVSYTNQIIEKIKAAGIEVVTDKDDFDRILLQEERLQKMAGKTPKWLTVDDVKFLSELGYKKFDEIVQIQEAILLSNYELNDKKVSVNKAIEVLGRVEFLGSVSRSAFHWTSGNSKNGNHVHFDSSILFNRDNQNREKLEKANKESREHIGILNDILTKESYFTFNSEDSRKFVEQVNEWVKENSNPQKLIVVGKIPPVMRILGISDRLIEVEHSTLNKMIRDYPLYPDDKQGHKLNIDVIRSIPSELANPVMVFKSKTRTDSYVFFTERKDSVGRSILIPLAADKRKGRIVINEITSMYGRNNEIDFVKSNFDEDKLLYIDKERAEQWNKEWSLKTKSSGGELVTKVQFLGQRITDIETCIPSILTKERLVNFISGNDKSEYLQKMTAGENTYGFVHNDKIYLNPEIMNSNAAVHEYTHLWDTYTQKTNLELWNKGLKMFKDTKYWNEVISDPNYQYIKDDENLVLSEIHARISGDIAEKVLNRIAELDGEQVKLDAIDWNKETWNYICEVMLHKSYSDDYNINYPTGLSSADLTEFLSTPMKDLISGKNINIPISFNYDEFRKEDFGRFVKGYNTSLAVGRDGVGEYYGRLKSGKVHTDIHIRDNGISLEHYYPKDGADYGEYEGENGKFDYECYPGFLLREEALKEIDISNCSYDEFISFISKECIDSMKDNEEVFEAAKGPLVDWEDIVNEKVQKEKLSKPYNSFVNDTANLDLGIGAEIEPITGLSAGQVAIKYAGLKDKCLDVNQKTALPPLHKKHTRRCRKHDEPYMGR